MIIDGKKLAEEIKISLKKEVAALGRKIRLAAVMVSEDAASLKFLEQKKKFGQDLGVEVKVYNLPSDISTNKLRQKVSEIVHIKQNSGVIIQLPLPCQINAQYILNAVPPEKDVDVLSARALGSFGTGKPIVLPPIVGAVKFIVENVRDSMSGKLEKGKVVIVGAGRLVGRPLAVWFLNQGATVSVLNKHTKDIKEFAKKADILIAGAGQPGLIKEEMIKKGAVVIDAGTAESNGRLLGDIDPAAGKKASVFAPVPGGIGPLVVAMVFKNLIELAILKRK